MKTISAKEFRANLDSILERVNAGEEIIVKHRFREPVVLSNFKRPKAPASEKAPGVMAFVRAPKKPHGFDSNKSYKELYREMMEKKYGV